VILNQSDGAVEAVATPGEAAQSNGHAPSRLRRLGLPLDRDRAMRVAGVRPELH
jgi:hypothetical protein